MSSASSYTRGFETASQLSLTLSCALRDVKAESLRDEGAAQPTFEELVANKARLVEILLALEAGLVAPVNEVSEDLPDGLVAWLRAAHRGDAITAGGLAAVRERIEDEEILPVDDIQLLERVERIVSAHAHHLFLNVSRQAARAS